MKQSRIVSNAGATVQSSLGTAVFVGRMHVKDRIQKKNTDENKTDEDKNKVDKDGRRISNKNSQNKSLLKIDKGNYGLDNNDVDSASKYLDTE